jgi:c-di-GMP-binding flagellar brake protein YcgR
MSAPSAEKKLRAKQKGWQRRYPRHRADFPLKATSLGEEGYEAVQGRCSDIGHGGMGAVLTTNVHPGEVLSLEFRLPDAAAPLTVRAIVRYRRGFIHGLEFLGPSAEQQSAIDSFCADVEIVD